MPKYRVVHNYRADRLGPYEAGDVVELDKVVADHINRDSPGCLVPHAPPPPAPAPEPERAVTESRDRMARKGQNRKEG